MIQVQATKAQSAPEPIAEQYALKDEKKSATPFAFGAIVMAVVLYIKSLASGHTEADAASARPEAEPPAGKPAKGDGIKETLAAEEHGKLPDDVPSTGGLSEYSALRSNVVELAAYRPLQINDSPLLDFWKAATGTRFMSPGGVGARGPGFKPAGRGREALALLAAVVAAQAGPSRSNAAGRPRAARMGPRGRMMPTTMTTMTTIRRLSPIARLAWPARSAC